MGALGDLLEERKKMQKSEAKSHGTAGNSDGYSGTAPF
jgi:hypothetical protein